MGAESFLKSLELDRNKQVRTLEQKLLMSENDLKNKKTDLEEERNNFILKINDMEREKAKIRANESALNDKIKELRQEFELQLKRNQDLFETTKDRSTKQEKDLVDKLKLQEEKYNNLRVTSQQSINDLEKQNALLAQEMNFSKRELSNLQTKIESLDSENRRLKLESGTHFNNLEKTKQKVNEMENIKNQEIGFVKTDAEKRLKEVIEI